MSVSHLLDHDRILELVYVTNNARGLGGLTGPSVRSEFVNPDRAVRERAGHAMNCAVINLRSRFGDRSYRRHTVNEKLPLI
jgi:hypothetical protein